MSLNLTIPGQQATVCPGPRPIPHGATSFRRHTHSLASPQFAAPLKPLAEPRSFYSPVTSVRVGATATRDVAYRPSLSRQTTDPLPPAGSKATGLVQLAEGLWCLRQDFWLTENIYLNSHVARLRSGGLLVISPPACTEEAAALLDSLPGGAGAVEHVLLPSLSPEHWLHAAGWAARFAPHATLWTVPGLLEGRSVAGLPGLPERLRQLKASYHRIAPLPVTGPLPGLEEEVSAATFSEAWGLFTESTLLLRHHRAVAFSDMAFAIYEHPVRPFVGEQLSKMVGIYRRLGAPVATPLLRKDPAAGRAWLDAVLSWDFDTVLPGHLDPVVGPPGGKQQVRECFAFLLQEQRQRQQEPQ